jgi:beta-glucosidase
VAPGAALTPWRNSVDAITFGFMPGQEYGNALADVLFGDVNPSAKLPLTLPTRENEVNFTESDWPGVGKPQRVATYSEKLLVGYRWYDAHGVTPAFPFGHGLSYSTFTLSNLHASRDAVGVLLSNTGTAYGAAAPQLYLTFPAAAGEPPFQLKGVTSIPMPPGTFVNVTFPLDLRSRSIWDVETHSWAEVKGTFGVTVGFSSRDPKALKGSFNTELTRSELETA